MKDKAILATYFSQTTNSGLMYTPKQEDTQEDVEKPVLLMIPGGLVEWMLTTPRTVWELQKE